MWDLAKLFKANIHPGQLVTKQQGWETLLCAWPQQIRLLAVYNCTEGQQKPCSPADAESRGENKNGKWSASVLIHQSLKSHGRGFVRFPAVERRPRKGHREHAKRRAEIPFIIWSFCIYLSQMLMAKKKTQFDSSLLTLS